MEYVTDSEYVIAQWRRILEHNTYDRENSRHWEQNRDMMQQGKVFGITLGRGEEYNGRFCQTAALYAIEALTRAEVDDRG
jgi:hypothetical protein